MKDFKKKQRVRHFIYSTPALIALFVLTFFLAKGAFSMVNKARISYGLSKDVAERSTALALREKELNAEIARLQTEEGVKNEIKEKFSVTQEGEYVAVIVDERKASTSTDKDTLPWYKKFWFAIMGENK